MKTVSPGNLSEKRRNSRTILLTLERKDKTYKDSPTKSLVFIHCGDFA